jgi:glutathione S-transferase
MPMKLFYTTASPFSRKVRASIVELGLQDEIELSEITQPTVPTNYIPELSRENPLGKVPVLVLSDGQRIADSIVIAEYLDARGGRRLFPTDATRWTALTLQAQADGIIEAGVACRLEGLRPENLRWPDWRDAHVQKIVSALDAIEAEPSYLDAEFHIGQLALVCAIEWIAFRDVYKDAKQGRPRLAAWLDAVSERPSLKSTRP